MADPVSCHSGSQYAEYPLAFSFQDESMPVDEILARWRTPAGKRFRVRSAGRVFDLIYDEAHDLWRVEQFCAQYHAEESA
jgi:hypothetical protein